MAKHLKVAALFLSFFMAFVVPGVLYAAPIKLESKKQTPVVKTPVKKQAPVKKSSSTAPKQQAGKSKTVTQPVPAKKLVVPVAKKAIVPAKKSTPVAPKQKNAGVVKKSISKTVVKPTAPELNVSESKKKPPRVTQSLPQPPDASPVVQLSPLLIPPPAQSMRFGANAPETPTTTPTPTIPPSTPVVSSPPATPSSQQTVNLGSSCDRVTTLCASGLECRASKCERRISKIGEVCGTDPTVPVCEGNLLCSEGRCWRKVASLDQSCGSGGPTDPICWGRLVCDGGKCSRQAAYVGDVCGSSVDDPLCTVGLVCSTSNRCERKSAGLGESCGTGLGDAVCRGRLVCTSGTCARLRAYGGEVCGPEPDGPVCAPPLVCGASSTCERKIAGFNESCGNDPNPRCGTSLVCGQDQKCHQAPASWWKPVPGISWQIQFVEPPINTSVDAALFDLDLYDTSESVISDLHRQGKRVVCYVNMGAWEDWRPDKDQYPQSVLGNNYEGWPGERWVDIRQIDLLAPIIGRRLDLCKTKGFNGVDPDNLNGYQNATGFPLTASDQLRFNTFVADAAHQRGLAVGLKNDSAQARDLLNSFDWIVTEGCAAEGWCRDVKFFIDSGKPVLQIEYTDTGIAFQSVCGQYVALNFSPILKRRNLNAWLERCAQ